MKSRLKSKEILRGSHSQQCQSLVVDLLFLTPIDEHEVKQYINSLKNESSPETRWNNGKGFERNRSYFLDHQVTPLIFK